MRTCILCHKKVKLAYQNLYDDRYGAPGRYTVYQCSSCGFGRLFPNLGKQEIGRFYAKYYPLASQTSESVKNSVRIPNQIGAWLRGINKTAHRHIRSGSTVLDIGCGSGISLLEIEKLGGSAFGVEPDHNAQKIAKKLNLRIHQGFITDNFFPGIKFDYVTASQVIEHDPDPNTFMKAVNKRLKDKGQAILSFPNVGSLAQKMFKEKWIHWHVPYHCNFFTKKSFTRLAKLSGFKIKEIKTTTPNLWTIKQVRMLFTKPEEGKTSPVWSVKTQSSQVRQTFTSLVKRKFITSIIMLLSLLIIPVNRIVDLFGQGDSFFVILEKK
jgi:2-polyprenyl-3-methyl-5-hydroxy-6-metoxy-1,4-benzoquinol methylase